MTDEEERIERCARIIELLDQRGQTIVTAESCTAGLLAATFGSVSGASRVLWGGFVSYRIEAKVRMYAVSHGDIERWGAVSAETAVAMARGALLQSGSDVAVSTVCYADPDDSGPKGPGLFGWVAVVERAGSAATKRVDLTGRRDENRAAVVAASLGLLEDRLGLTAV